MIANQAIDYLGTLFATAVSVSVYEGQPTAVNDRQFVVVNSTGETGEDLTTVRLEPSTLGPGTWLDESGEVACSAWSWSGGTDMSARRAEALSLGASCVTAVQADRTLGGLLVGPDAVVSELRLEATQFKEGPLARVSFTVAYQALNT